MNDYRILIDLNEYQTMVLDYICSNEFNKMVNGTIFKDDPKCKQAIMHGMIIASLLSSTCEHIID